MAGILSPPHREAFPRLDIIEAEKVHDRLSAPVCIFSQQSKVVGQLFIVDSERDAIIVNYLFASPYLECNEHQVALKTSSASSPLYKERRSLLCPLCEGRRRILYYRHLWACADCLKLFYRSQLLDKEVKLWARHDDLAERVGRGRPKGMHNSTYHELLRQLASLRVEVRNKTRKYASELHNTTVTSRWHEAAKVDFWSGQYTARGGSFVRLGMQ